MATEPTAKLSEYYGELPPTASSLWALLNAGFESSPDSIAVTAMHQPADYLSTLRRKASQQSATTTCLQWSFADLHQASLLIAHGFHERGVKRGTTLVTFLSNGIECMIMLWVSAVMQLTLAPLDPRLLDGGREGQLQDYLRRLDPAVVVVPTGEGAEKIELAVQALGMAGPGLKVSIEEIEMAEWVELIKLAPSGKTDISMIESSLAQEPAIDREGKRIAAIYFTSGTTSGRPKGCPRTVQNLLSGATGMFAMPHVADRAILHTPNSGTIAQAFMLVYASTGKHVIMPAATFSPSAALDAIEQFGAESMVAIPVMSRMFEKEMASKQRDLSALKRVGLGGDMVTVDAKEKFESLFPGVAVEIGHGMSEGHALIGWRGHPEPSRYPEYQGILGIGYPQHLVRICDGEGSVLPRGEAGELHVGGPRVIEHYLENAQPESFYSDERGNWMLTGDRAFMDEDGVIFIIGRNKDIIKRVGLTLSPAVAEAVLNANNGVEVR